MKNIAVTLIALLAFAGVSLAQPRVPGGGPGMYSRQSTGVGDQSKGYIIGTAVLSPDVPGGDEVPGAGVTVLVKFMRRDAKDSLYTIVGERGVFYIRDIPVGKAEVSFSMIGYETLSKVVDINPGENKIIANLKPHIEELQSAIIKESVPPLTISGDTLVFNPAAVKTNKGEMAIDVLEQMPGVEVSNGSVTILNEKLENVYVDGALLFGDAPMKALEQLPAEEIVKMRSYQEYANKDPNHKISQTESKQRVLDIQTKSKPKMVINGDVLAGAGFDTDSTYHKFRYTAGVNLGLSSETLQVSFKVNANNINDGSTRRRSFVFAGGVRRETTSNSPDLRDISVSAQVNKKWMSKTARNFVLGEVGGGYSYNNKYDVSESRSTTDYFARPGEYETRRNESSSFRESRTSDHAFSLNASKALKDGSISINGKFNIGDSRVTSEMTNYNYQDDLDRQGMESKTTSGRSKDFPAMPTSLSGGANLNFSKGFVDKYRIGLAASFNMANNNGFSVREDLTTSTITQKVLEIGSYGKNYSFNLSPTFRYEISDKMSLTFAYSYQNSFEKKLREAFDVSIDGAHFRDVVNTEHLTYDENRHVASVTFNNFFSAIKANMSLMVGIQSIGANRNEMFPESDIIDRRFNSPTVQFFFGNDSMIDRWGIRFTSSATAPALEQMSSRLDNSNLYNVTVGNPNLKQSLSNSISFNYSSVVGKGRQAIDKETTVESMIMGHIAERKMSGESSGSGRGARSGGSGVSGRSGSGGGMMGGLDKLNTIFVTGSFTARTNTMANKRIYFTEDTYLPQYEYTMPAQSTLSTYENVKGAFSANLSLMSNIFLSKIACNLGIGGGFSWDSTPSFVNSDLVRTNNFRPNVSLSFRSNFSKIIRLSLSADASYVYNVNTQNYKNDYFTERLSANVDVNNIFKHMYIGASYSKVFTQGIEYKSINDNILNANLGVKFGPKNNFDISVTASDIFNKNTGFSTTTTADYVLNKWPHNFGRYLLFTFAYRFNNMQKTK